MTSASPLFSLSLLLFKLKIQHFLSCYKCTVLNVDLGEGEHHSKSRE